MIVRLVLLAALGIGGLLAYQKLDKSTVNKGLAIAAGQIRGLTGKLNIDTQGVMKVVNDKLVESRPIIESGGGNVMGDTTSQIGNSAQQLVQEAAGKITAEIKDLPKQEAVKITRQVCDQIIENLEK